MSVYTRSANDNDSIDTTEKKEKDVDVVTPIKLKIPQTLQERIIDKVTTNRITIVVGGTGCGKSTLVPQLLLQHVGSPVLCTMPRRLAVVAVASHVAQQRNTVLGGNDVGYHIGQTRVATNETKLLFCSAGILLEDLRANGIEALTKYKVILIDECHERSSESDLCLTIIKAFMIAYPRAQLRVILMSATFNHGQYTEYFDGVPQCEYIDTITLETGGSIRDFYSNVDTYYLTDIFNMIPSHIMEPFETVEFLNFQRQMRRDPNSELVGDDGGKTLSRSLLILILLLVVSLHQQEPSDAIFLIFAPTYVQLEQIYDQLREVMSILNPIIHVLHSSIDMEDCLKSMKSSNTSSNNDGKRRILLASAIADSSVTIPGVTAVIDTCRMLEVKWDANKEVHIPKTVWASKSICDQRRGRTGRTCKGKVYRLLDQSFYINHLKAWDQPQLELASTRDEVLALLSTNNKILSDPSLFLMKCMDPPPKVSVEKAIEYLKKIGACTEIKISNSKKKKKLVPTDVGQLLASLPLTASEGSIIIRGAQIGMLHEAVALVTIMSTRPLPIVHVFGDSYRTEQNLKQYYPDVNPRDAKSKVLANFAAYLFWHIHWNTKIRGNAARQRFQQCTDAYHGATNHENDENILYANMTNDDLKVDDCNVWHWSEEVDEAHIQWCQRNSINPTSVRAIANSIDVTMKTLYKKDHDEKEWLRYQKGDPTWDHWVKTATQRDLMNLHSDIFGQIYGMSKKDNICNLMISLQDSSALVTTDSTSLIPTISKTPQAMACIHFLRGNCKFGDNCKNLHSFAAPRPICRFYPGCTNTNCLFSHSPPTSTCTQIPTTSRMSQPIIFPQYEGGALAWYKKAAPSLLLFGEADFTFTKSLYRHGIYPYCATAYDSTIPSSISQYCDYNSVDATRVHIDSRLKDLNVQYFAWNFPFTGNDEDDTVHETLLSGTFLSVAQFIASQRNQTDYAMSKINYEFAIALQGDQFSRWSVHKVAQRCGFSFSFFNEFDMKDLPGYVPKRANYESFPAQDSRFYIFQTC